MQVLFCECIHPSSQVAFAQKRYVSGDAGAVDTVESFMITMLAHSYGLRKKWPVQAMFNVETKSN